MIDHGTQAVDVGAGQSSADALLHNIEAVVHHAGGQLTLFVCIHGNSLKKKNSGHLNLTDYVANVASNIFSMMLCNIKLKDLPGLVD